MIRYTYRGDTMDLQLILIYILIIWIISTFVTIYDKIAAKRKWQRTPEKNLLFLGALGGAGIMLLLMKAIGHKTRKKKFMISLPIFLVIHILLVALYCHLQYSA